MTTEPKLSQRLKRVPTTFHTGTWYRQVASSIALVASYQPLATSHTLTQPGRYHPEGIEALYLANSQDTAARETRSVLPIPSGVIPVPEQPMLTLSIQVAVQKMLVLDGSGVVFSLLQTSYQELTGLWDYEGQPSPTQALGQSAHDLGIEAIKVPSSVAFGQFNLIVFPTCLLKGSYIETIDHSGRFHQRIEGKK